MRRALRRAVHAAWLLPLVPLATGVAIMIAGGAPRSRWATQLGAGAAGLVVHLAARAVPRSLGARLLMPGVLVVLAALAATLAGEGMEGVYRWIRLGPLLLHPSALFAPLLLVLAWQEIEARPRATLLSLGLVQALHVAQPDAGQATAFGVAALVLLWDRRAVLGTRGAALSALVVAGTIGLAWARPDPLGPAPFVEDIVRRAFGLGPAAGGIALASLVLLAATPLLVRDTASSAKPILRPAAVVLSAYLACSAAVVLAGEFPVPLLGFGASPVVGAFLGLAALRRADLAGAPSR